jgi:hypothetical protein
VKRPLFLALLCLAPCFLAPCFLATGSAFWLIGCSPSEPETGSQTNWIKACEVSADCGALSCICSTCTRPCDDDAGCADLEGASCVPAAEDGAVAVCGGERFPSAGLCLARCEGDSCGEGLACIAGVCSGSVDASGEVTVDLTVRFQTLVGFGASIAYAEDAITNHPEKEALFDLMFEDLGVDVVRMRNRFEGDNQAELEALAEILAAAADRLGHAPTTLMTEGSPPAELKANGARVCDGNADCTLVQLPSGEFDYAGLANHWRASLEAHAALGISVDYLSVQNNPNWLPPEAEPADACHFLPVEGTEMVLVDGTETEVAYAGFAEALAAVTAAIGDLPAVPQIVAPEVTGPAALEEYVSALEPGALDALGYHVYDVDPMAIDRDALVSVRTLGEELELPVFQTEMQADGLSTALLMQSTLTDGGASTYLQNDFVGMAEGGDPNALISLDADSFEAESTFHAMRHFTRFTDPGWVRVEAEVDAEEVLASAWLSEDEQALSVVIVNAAATEQSVRLDLGGEEFNGSEVTRTAFDGVERSVTLGPLPVSGLLDLPAHAMVTVAFER